MPRRTQQFIGREGETATLYERRSFKVKAFVGGFAPRQLKRSAASRYSETFDNLKRRLKITRLGKNAKTSSSSERLSLPFLP